MVLIIQRTEKNLSRTEVRPRDIKNNSKSSLYNLYYEARLIDLYERQKYYFL